MEHRPPAPEEAERQARRLAERIGMRLGLPDSATGVRRNPHDAYHYRVDRWQSPTNGRG